ncbi:MAG: cytosine deaminase, partial [Actinomycetales bacterium]
MQVYSAALVIPITGPSILGGSVAVKGSRILHVGERDWVLTTLAGTNFVELRTDGVLMPGLVNAHTHLQYTGMAELGQGQYHGFSDWAAAFNAIYDHTSHDWAKAAAAGANQCLRYGTTTVADVVTDAEAGSALGDIGLHGVTYWEVMDWSNSDWQDHGHDTVLAQLAKLPKTPGLGLSPHAPYSLETAPLLDVPDLARHRGMRLHIHLAESQLEAEWAAGRSGALADLWRSEVSSLHALRKFGVGHSATEFIDQLGVLGPDCHVAHGVYTTAQDRQLLRARGTTVALCPRSNQVIGLAAPPVAAYLQEG